MAMKDTVRAAKLVSNYAQVFQVHHYKREELPTNRTTDLWIVLATKTGKAWLDLESTWCLPKKAVSKIEPVQIAPANNKNCVRDTSAKKTNTETGNEANMSLRISKSLQHPRRCGDMYPKMISIMHLRFAVRPVQDTSLKGTTIRNSKHPLLPKTPKGKAHSRAQGDTSRPQAQGKHLANRQTAKQPGRQASKQASKQTHQETATQTRKQTNKQPTMTFRTKQINGAHSAPQLRHVLPPLPKLCILLLSLFSCPAA